MAHHMSKPPNDSTIEFLRSLAQPSQMTQALTAFPEHRTTPPFLNKRALITAMHNMAVRIKELEQRVQHLERQS